MSYSEAAAYYQDFCTGYWHDEDPAACPCHGGGWALSEVDTWHKCPAHFCGQLHPEDWFEKAEEYAAVATESLLVWAVEHGRAEYTREEAARRTVQRGVTINNVPPRAPLAEDDIPF